MAYKQLSFEEDSVNRIKSHLNTLNRYLQTSMALHNRPLQSVFSLAAARGDMVHAIVEANPDSAEVARWGAKFDDFVKQHGLDEPRVGD